MKFRGNYHGHADGLLVEAGSGALTLGRPSSAGVPEEYARLTLVAEYNDPEGLAALFQRYGEEIAAVIFEPVVGNSGVLEPTPEFLKVLRDLTRTHGALLIADEVMTGFRLAFGGATERYGLEPDLVTLGKILGGGLPAAAYAGRREIMAQVAPLGPVYQAGTLSGNPVAMAAGLATLRGTEAPNFYELLTEKTRRLADGIVERARARGIAMTANTVGGMFGLFFTEAERVENFYQVGQCDLDRFRLFFHEMLERGVYLAPSAYEAGFVSAAHDDAAIDETLAAAEAVFAGMG